MNLSDPSDVGLAKVPARILATLASVTGPMTVRQLARVSGVSLTRTQHWVHHWAERGVVNQQHAGRAILCSLNREHVMTESLITLAHAREAMLTCIASEVSMWGLPPISVSAFGSFARGQGTIHSDIDLFVVYNPTDLDAWHQQLARSAEALRIKVGNRIEWYDVSATDWHRMKQDHDPLARELANDVIHIFGDYLSLIPQRTDTQ